MNLYIYKLQHNQKHLKIWSNHKGCKESCRSPALILKNASTSCCFPLRKLGHINLEESLTGSTNVHPALTYFELLNLLSAFQAGESVRMIKQATYPLC